MVALMQCVLGRAREELESIVVSCIGAGILGGWEESAKMGVETVSSLAEGVLWELLPIHVYRRLQSYPLARGEWGFGRRLLSHCPQVNGGLGRVVVFLLDILEQGVRQDQPFVTQCWALYPILRLLGPLTCRKYGCAQGG